MSNCIVNYKSIQDGISTVNTLRGECSCVGNLFRVVFFTENENKKSKHVYVRLSDNSFKITVSGDTNYGITVKEGESANATITGDGVNFPFTAYTDKCRTLVSDKKAKFYAEYDIIAFNQVIKNVLSVNIEIL